MPSVEPPQAHIGQRVPYTDFPAQFAAQREEILRAVEAVFERGDFILGREVERFEAEFASLCGVSHAIGVASGTMHGWTRCSMPCRVSGARPSSLIR